MKCVWCVWHSLNNWIFWWDFDCVCISGSSCAWGGTKCDRKTNVDIQLLNWEEMGVCQSENTENLQFDTKARSVSLVAELHWNESQSLFEISRIRERCDPKKLHRRSAFRLIGRRRAIKVICLYLIPFWVLLLLLLLLSTNGVLISLFFFHRLIQSVLKDSDGFVGFVVSTVEEVYTVLDTLIEEIEIVLSLAIEEVSVGEHGTTTLLTFPNLDVPSVPNELTSDLVYLQEMKRMDQETLDQWRTGNRSFKQIQMSHVVPVSGLVVGKVQVLAMELETAIEIWGHTKQKTEDVVISEKGTEASKSGVTSASLVLSSLPQTSISISPPMEVISRNVAKSPTPGLPSHRSETSKLIRSPSTGSNRRNKMNALLRNDTSLSPNQDQSSSSHRKKFRNLFASSTRQSHLTPIERASTNDENALSSLRESHTGSPLSPEQSTSPQSSHDLNDRSLSCPLTEFSNARHEDVTQSSGEPFLVSTSKKKMISCREVASLPLQFHWRITMDDMDANQPLQLEIDDVTPPEKNDTNSSSKAESPSPHLYISSHFPVRSSNLDGNPKAFRDLKSVPSSPSGIEAFLWVDISFWLSIFFFRSQWRRRSGWVDSQEAKWSEIQTSSQKLHWEPFSSRLGSVSLVIKLEWRGWSNKSHHQINRAGWWHQLDFYLLGSKSKTECHTTCVTVSCGSLTEHDEIERSEFGTILGNEFRSISRNGSKVTQPFQCDRRRKFSRCNRIPIKLCGKWEWFSNCATAFSEDDESEWVHSQAVKGLTHERKDREGVTCPILQHTLSNDWMRLWMLRKCDSLSIVRTPQLFIHILSQFCFENRWIN